MYNIFKLAMPALILSLWLTVLPAAQAQTPAGFNFLSAPGAGPSQSQSHLNGFLDDSTLDIFAGYIGISLAMNWVDSLSSHNDTSVTPMKTSSTVFSEGTLSSSPRIANVPAAVPELSTGVSTGLMLTLGLGGIVANARRRAHRFK